jgi:hypothetical protein
MAERIVSPGVFTNEVDQSFLAGGVAQIGAAIVGPTVKGPALIPTKITSYGEYVATFGSNTDDSLYVPFVVQDYLRNGNVITVTRLLYEDGYYLTNGALAIIAKSGSGAGAVQTVTHVLHPTQAVTSEGATALFEDSVLLNGGSGSFAIRISGSYAAGPDSAIGFSGAFSHNISLLTSSDVINKVYITQNTKSLSLNVGREVFENTRFSLGYSISDTTTEPSLPLTSKFYSSGKSEKLSQGLTYDDTDNYLNPTSGLHLNLSNSIAVKGLYGQYNFGSASAVVAYYLPLNFSDNFKTNFPKDPVPPVINKILLLNI